MLRIPLDLAVAIQSRLALAYQQSDELRLPQVSHHFLWLGLTLSPRPLPFSLLALFCSKQARLPLRLFLAVRLSAAALLAATALELVVDAALVVALVVALDATLVTTLAATLVGAGIST